MNWPTQKPEQNRFILAWIPAGAFLVLLVILSSSVPFLAHLLRPRPYCTPGPDCWTDAIQAVIWHARWFFPALGAILIVYSVILAVRTGPISEAESPEKAGFATTSLGIGSDFSSNTDSPAHGMSAKEIAALLPGPWTTDASGCAYPHPQRRVRIAIETNCNLEALRYERRDPHVDCDEFARDLLAIIGDDLCARDQLALVRVLAERLTAWHARRGSSDDPVRECFEEILHRHVEYFSE